MKRCQEKLPVINYSTPTTKTLEYWNPNNKFISFHFNESQNFNFENNLIRKWEQTSHKIPKTSRPEKYEETEALSRQHGLFCLACPTSAALPPFWFPLTLLSLVSLLNFLFLCSLNVFHLSQQMISTGCGSSPVAGWQCHPLSPHDYNYWFICYCESVKNKPALFKHPEKNQIWVHIYSGIWGKRGGRWSNMPATFLAANNFGQLQLLYVLLQQNCILTESFSLLQQSVCNRWITWQQAPLGCTGQYTCARSACFQS